MDKSNINFLQLVFFLKACKGATYPGVGKMPGGTVPAPNPNSGQADFLVGLSEVARLIKDSEIGMSK